MSTLEQKLSPERKMFVKMLENKESDDEEIGRQVALGNTSGIIDNEAGYRISWELSVNKFKH